MITVTATESEIRSAGEHQILVNGQIDPCKKLCHEDRRNTKTGEIIHIWTQKKNETRPRR